MRLRQDSLCRQVPEGSREYCEEQIHTRVELGLPWWLGGKESACNAVDTGLIPWVTEIPWRRKWQPTPVFLPGESHGQRNLAGYSPWGRKELDMTEQPSTHTRKNLKEEVLFTYQGEVSSGGVISKGRGQST